MNDFVAAQHLQHCRTIERAVAVVQHLDDLLALEHLGEEISDEGVLLGFVKLVFVFSILHFSGPRVVLANKSANEPAFVRSLRIFLVAHVRDVY